MAALQGYVGALYVAQSWAVSIVSPNKAVISDSLTSGELDFASGKDFTVELWANTVMASGALLDKNGATIGYKVDVSDSRLRFTVDDGTSDATAICSTTPNSDWHHWVFVRDAGTMIYTYMDGEFETSDTDDTGDLSNGSDLEMVPSDTTQFGLIRVFNRAVSAAQVSDLYKGGFPGALSGSVVGEWRSHEGSGSTLYDASGYDNHATLVGATWVSTTYNTITNESDTGDGTTVAWTLDNINLDTVGLAVDIDGVTKLIGNDFTLSPKGVITFTTAPASDANIHTTYRYYPTTTEAGGFTEWTIDSTVDVADITDFTTTGWRKMAPVLKTWSASAQRHWINSLTADMIGRKYIVKFYIDEANDLYYTGWGIVNGIHPVTDVDTIVNEGLDFAGTDNLVWQSDV